MDKNNYYREQAEKFIEYMAKFHEGDILSLFNEWAFSKEFSCEDRIGIWKIVRTLPKAKRKKTTKTSSDAARLSAVLEILFQNDLARLEKLINKDKDKDKENGEQKNNP